MNIDDTSPASGGARPAHTELLGRHIPVLEHLCGLDQLDDEPFRLFAVPPMIRGLATFPVRASSPSCEADVVGRDAAGAHKGMVWVDGGEFSMGSADFYPEEQPVRRWRSTGSGSTCTRSPWPSSADS